MARFKVLAHHALIGLGVLALFGVGSGVAYHAAGAALSLGGYVYHR